MSNVGNPHVGGQVTNSFFRIVGVTGLRAYGWLQKRFPHSRLVTLQCKLSAKSTGLQEWYRHKRHSVSGTHNLMHSTISTKVFWSALLMVWHVGHLERLAIPASRAIHFPWFFHCCYLMLFVDCVLATFNIWLLHVVMSWSSLMSPGKKNMCSFKGLSYSHDHDLIDWINGDWSIRPGFCRGVLSHDQLFEPMPEGIN